MKDTKRQLAVFSFFDHTHIEAYLERMARGGWMLESMGDRLWTYRRTEPRNVHFTVSYAPKASAFDPDLTEEQREFIDFCERTDWRFVASNAQMQAFCNEQRDPVPIQTDPELELEALHKAAKRVQIPIYCALIVLSLVELGMFLSDVWDDPVEWLASGSGLIAVFAWLGMIVPCAGELATYLLWRKRALKAAERGEFLATPNLTAFARVVLVVELAAFFAWAVSTLTYGNPLLRLVLLLTVVYTVFLFAAVNGTKNLLKRKGASRGKNRAVTLTVDVVLAFGLVGLILWVAFHASDNGWLQSTQETAALPLVVSDLLDVDEDDYLPRRYDRSSPLLAQLEAHEYFDFHNKSAGTEVPPGLDYTVTDVKAAFLYGFCKDRLLGRQGKSDAQREIERYMRWKVAGIPDAAETVAYRSVDAAAWGAEEAYRLYWREDGEAIDHWLLCWGSRFVEIDLDWAPTAEQMAIVGEKLRG